MGYFCWTAIVSGRYVGTGHYEVQHITLPIYPTIVVIKTKSGSTVVTMIKGEDNSDFPYPKIAMFEGNRISVYHNWNNEGSEYIYAAF